MTTCNHCQSIVSDADLAINQCPHCQAPLDDKRPETVTESNVSTIDFLLPWQGIQSSTSARQPDLTVDLDSRHVASTVDLPLTDNAGIAKTIDHDSSRAGDNLIATTVDIGLGAVGERPSTVGTGAASPTFDYQSGQPGGFDLQALWGSAVSASKPLMTLHGGHVARSEQPNCTLVVGQRAIRAKADTNAAIADYDLTDVLGQGGMGVVFAARQASIDREVAVKMMRPETMGNESQRRKFLFEAAVTGELDHPNIVPIYDLGQSADGAFFYSMKKIQGTPWSSVIREKGLVDNLAILMKVADAIAFAHARSVVHRDLKPENVMLGDFGEVLVLDWGVALAVQTTGYKPKVSTDYRMAGTPVYMAPELVIGPFDSIGPHSDVYLLGAILYEIITGQPPHTGINAIACLQAAARNEIAPTDKRGELVDIAMKAMATNPGDRYSSVKNFQEAVRQYQSHSESVVLCDRAEHDLNAAVASDDYRDFARALFAFEEAYALWNGNQSAIGGISRSRFQYASSAHRKGDFDLGLSLIDPTDPDHGELKAQLFESKRERDVRQFRLKRARRIAAGLAGMVFLAVTVGIVLVSLLKVEADRQAEIARENEIEASYQAGIARENESRAVAQEKNAIAARHDAERRRKEAEYEAYGALIGLAAAKIDENALGQAHTALLACPPELRGWEWRRLAYVVQQGRGRQFAATSHVETLALSADESLLAAGCRDGVIRVWDLRTNNLEGELKLTGENTSIFALSFSPHEEDLLLIGSNAPDGYLRTWKVKGGNAQVVTDAQGHTDAVLHIAFSRDGRRFLTGSKDHTAKLWQLDSVKPLVTFRGHSSFVWCAEFAPDESHIATASEDGTVRLWNADSGTEWAASDGRRIPFTGHRGPVYAVTFLPPESGEAIEKSASSTPTGDEYVASAGYDKRILLWKPSDLKAFDYRKLLDGKETEQTPALEMLGHTGAVRSLALSPDGNRLLSSSSDHTLRLWYARDEDIGYAIVARGKFDKELRGHDGPVPVVRFSAVNSDLIASGSYDGTVRCWNVGAYHEQRPIPGLVLRGHLDAIAAARFSKDGRSIVTASPDRTAKKWRVSDGVEELTFREGHAYLASRAAFSTHGDRLFTSGADGTVRVWSTGTGAELFQLEGTGYRAAAALSVDGKWIVTGSEKELPVNRDGVQVVARYAVQLWDAQTGKPIQVYPGHKVPITALAFSVDGEIVYSGDDNGVGNLWERHSGRHLARLDFHLGPITAAVFTPDGKGLLTASIDGTVCPWNVADAARVEPLHQRLLKHPQAVTTFALTPDGARLLTGCDDGQLRLWNLNHDGLIWTQPAGLAADQSARVPASAQGNRRINANINAVAIHPNGNVALSVDSVNQIVRLFDVDTGREVLVHSTDGNLDHFLRLRHRAALAWSATFSPDGRHVITVGGDEARLWDLQGTEVASFGPHLPLTFADFSPDDELVVTTGWDHSARLWNAKTGKAILTFADQTAGELGGHTAAVNSAVFSPDGKQVLTASEDKTARLWDIETKRVVRVFREHQSGVTRAIFLGDGRRFLTASRDGTAAVWQIDGAIPDLRLVGHTSAVLDIAVSSDKMFIVTGGADGSARIWNANTGSELLNLQGHSSEVNAVAFADNDRERLRVLTGSADHTAKLWDIHDALKASNGERRAPKELLTLRGHTRGVTSVAFSRDTNAILTASRDGVAILWPATDSTTLQPLETVTRVGSATLSQTR